MPGFTIIDSESALRDACKELASAGIVAMDTEFMREKTYSPKLCLVQLRGSGDPVLLDPLAMENLSPLEVLLQDTGVEVVLHSCRQDMEALDTRLDPGMTSLFDTQIAAAFCGLGDQVSYAALVERFSSVTLAKAHTRADWSRRPLPHDELDYAADDVRYLHDLRQGLQEQLDSQGRMPWFREECARQLDPAIWRPDPGQAWQRLKGAAALPVEAQETARQLAVWRENRALDKNRPREWVLPTPILLNISRNCPTSRSKLAQTEGINQGILRQSADDIVGICRNSVRDPNGPILWTARELLPPAERRQVKGIMGLLRQIAEEVGISASLLANRAAVERYVGGAANIELFEGWRLEVAGKRVLQDYS